MANKSILIMNTPACCAGCDLCDTFYDDWEVRCVATGSVLQTGAHYNRRMDDCPLISMEHFIQKTKEVLENE